MLSQRATSSSAVAPSDSTGTTNRFVAPSVIAAVPLQAAAGPVESAALDGNGSDEKVSFLKEVAADLFAKSVANATGDPNWQEAMLEQIFEDMKGKFQTIVSSIMQQITEHAMATLESNNAQNSGGYRSFVGLAPVVVRYASMSTEEHDQVVAAITKLINDEIEKLKSVNKDTTDYALQKITMHFTNPKAEPVAVVMPHDAHNTIAFGQQNRKVAALLHAGDKAQITVFDAQTHSGGVHAVGEGEMCATTSLSLAEALKAYFDETDFSYHFGPSQPFEHTTLVQINNVFVPALLSFAFELATRLQSKPAECKAAEELLLSEVFKGEREVECGGITVRAGASIVDQLQMWAAPKALALALGSKTIVHHIFELQEPMLDASLAALGFPSLSFVFKQFIVPACASLIREKAISEIEAVMSEQAKQREVLQLHHEKLKNALGTPRFESTTTEASGRLYPQMPVVANYDTGAAARPTPTFVMYEVGFTPLVRA